MTDLPLQLTAEHCEAIRRLQAAPKFNADRAHGYAGAPERVRARCEGDINDLLAQILDLPATVRAEAIHKLVRRALSRIDAYDAQERDRFCLYLEQIMDILGIADAAQLLHKWRYGTG